MENNQYDKIFNEILISKNVKKNFLKQYEDKNFASYLDMIFPEVEECFECNVKTISGEYNLMEQILNNVEEMNKLTAGMDSNTRRKFAYAMFVKDIVKVNYQGVRYINGQRHDEFPYYTWSSETVSQRALPKFNFKEDEIFEIKKILRYADIFDKFAFPYEHKAPQKITSEYVQEVIEKLEEFGDGEELFNKIILLNTAECKSFNNKEYKENK